MSVNNEIATRSIVLRRPSAVLLAVLCALYAAWIGAWLLERFLEAHVAWMQTGGGRFGYWLLMKLLLWVLPALAAIRCSGVPFAKTLGMDRPKAVALWGMGVGLLLGAIALLAKVLAYRPLFELTLGWSLLSGVAVAPVVEELAFRGAILPTLERRFRFWIANAITGALFLGAHLPGWYFQGCLVANLKNPVGGALSIFLLGMVFGYVAHKSRSVAASTCTHILNNFFNA